ncbi:hypothetical protein GCM10010965_27660 [Caldalkalibacillus thermarum]|uniref:hypothetical protein n=1 Tax=Caldalkalibacillus thermarum TaxID=296745 RepID=UPI0016685729|nr:hypothetical protein [Caldalkalibacillus thermarum]GGK33287.1 hypothetical protein GCM10010965_27660 [Caldalkalibacillus thermarum]
MLRRYVFKKTSSECGFITIEFIIAVITMTFIVFFPIAAMLEMHTINVMEQELHRALQMAAVRGGLTPDVQQAVRENLSRRGMDEVRFTSDSTFEPVQRGEIVTVGFEVKRPFRSLFSGVMSLIGGSDLASEHFVVKGKVMSEKLP